jgi:hypothetical protein
MGIQILYHESPRYLYSRDKLARAKILDLTGNTGEYLEFLAPTVSQAPDTTDEEVNRRSNED